MTLLAADALPAGAFLAGVLALTVIAASAAGCGLLLRRRLLAGWSGAPARLAEIVLALGALVLTCQAVGTAATFERWPLAAVLAALALALAAWERRLPPAGGSPPKPAGPRTSSLAIALTAGALGLVTWDWLRKTFGSLARGMRDFDTLWYHLPFAARFVQTGKLTDLAYVGNPPDSFLPANGELVHAVAMLAFQRDFVSPFVNLAWLVLALLAAWCIGRPWGAGAGALGAVAVVATIPVLVISQPGQAGTDIMGIALLLAAVGLLVNGHGSPQALTVAALAGGLAVGAKLTLVAPLLAVAVASIVLTRRGRRLGATGLWGLGIVAGGGFWYVRNAVYAANPLPWFHVGVGSVALPRSTTPTSDCGSTSLGHYIDDPHVLRHRILPLMDAALGPRWPLVVAVAAVGALLAVFQPRARTAIALVAIVSFAAYVITPATAGGSEGDPQCFRFNTRFATPALALALILVPLALAGRRRIAPWLAVAVLAAVTLLNVPLDGSLATAGRITFALLVALAVTAVAAYRHSIFRGWVVPASVGALVLAFFAGLWATQHRYFEHRYLKGGLEQQVGPIYRAFRGVEGARVAVAGFQTTYPVYGAALTNDVAFPARRTAHAGFRTVETCEGWLRALAAGRYDYVAVYEPGTTGRAVAAWTLLVPGAREILHERGNIVIRLPGAAARAHPSACAEN